MQVTARHNFTHDVKFEKQQEHVLVTQGIYRFVLAITDPQNLASISQAPCKSCTQANVENPLDKSNFAGIAGILGILAGSSGSLELSCCS